MVITFSNFNVILILITFRLTFKFFHLVNNFYYLCNLIFSSIRFDDNKINKLITRDWLLLIFRVMFVMYLIVGIVIERILFYYLCRYFWQYLELIKCFMTNWHLHSVEKIWGFLKRNHTRFSARMSILTIGL